MEVGPCRAAVGSALLVAGNRVQRKGETDAEPRAVHAHPDAVRGSLLQDGVEAFASEKLQKPLQAAGDAVMAKPLELHPA